MANPAGNHRYCPTCRRIYEGAPSYCPKDRTHLDPKVPVLDGKYILGQILGIGGMGVVYEAEQPAMERMVAVKLLNQERTSDPMMVQRFEREARAAGKINHRNVVTLYDIGRTESDQVFLIMERLYGEGLDQVLRREGPLKPERALPLFVQAVRGVSAAHAKGVVHRDLKPENLFITRNKGDDSAAGLLEEEVKVLDFGIAKLEAAGPSVANTLNGTVLGTMPYMAPEQLEGRPVDARADVYTLGLILMEMLSGRLPWGEAGEEMALTQCFLRLTQPPPLLAERCPYLVPETWQRLLDDMLASDPGRRPAHGGELLMRTRQILAAAAPPWQPRPRLIAAGAPDNSERQVAAAEVTVLATNPARRPVEVPWIASEMALMAARSAPTPVRGMPVGRRQRLGLVLGVAAGTLIAIVLLYLWPGLLLPALRVAPHGSACGSARAHDHEPVAAACQRAGWTPAVCAGSIAAGRLGINGRGC